MQRLASDFEALKREKAKGDDTLGKLRDVFSPQDAKAPDPLEAIEAEMDTVIQAAYEADKRGEPIPLTARGYLAALKAQADGIKFQNQLLERLAKIEGQANRAADPQSTINNQAYANLDNYVQQGLDRIYGQAENYTPVKKQQFNAVTNQMSQDLKRIMQERPEAWDQLRRDPSRQQAFVNHYLRQQLPPKAVEILERETLQNTDMTSTELMNAFREAGQIQDIEKRREIRAAIRQDILARMSGPQRRRG